MSFENFIENFIKSSTTSEYIFSILFFIIYNSIKYTGVSTTFLVLSLLPTHVYILFYVILRKNKLKLLALVFSSLTSMGLAFLTFSVMLFVYDAPQPLVWLLKFIGLFPYNIGYYILEYMAGCIGEPLMLRIIVMFPICIYLVLFKNLKEQGYQRSGFYASVIATAYLMVGFLWLSAMS